MSRYPAHDVGRSDRAIADKGRGRRHEYVETADASLSNMIRKTRANDPSHSWHDSLCGIWGYRSSERQRALRVCRISVLAARLIQSQVSPKFLECVPGFTMDGFSPADFNVNIVEVWIV